MRSSAQTQLKLSSDNYFPKKEDPILFFSLTQQPIFIKQDYSFSRSVDMIKRPMFCKMEDKLHKRFNVWITLRAGTDEDYRKLICDRK